MASLHDKLLHLGFDREDFRLRDDKKGAGPIIEAWLSGSPQPSQAAIDAVTDGEANTARRNNRFSRSFNLDKKDKAIIQWIADLHGITPVQARQQLRTIWDSL